MKNTSLTLSLILILLLLGTNSFSQDMQRPGSATMTSKSEKRSTNTTTHQEKAFDLEEYKKSALAMVEKYNENFQSRKPYDKSLVLTADMAKRLENDKNYQKEVISSLKNQEEINDELIKFNAGMVLKYSPSIFDLLYQEYTKNNKQ
jgi:hypothetical protein